MSFYTGFLYLTYFMLAGIVVFLIWKNYFSGGGLSEQDVKKSTPTKLRTLDGTEFTLKKCKKLEDGEYYIEYYGGGGLKLHKNGVQPVDNAVEVMVGWDGSRHWEVKKNG